jgi:hypothetical protein
MLNSLAIVATAVGFAAAAVAPAQAADTIERNGHTYYGGDVVWSPADQTAVNESLFAAIQVAGAQVKPKCIPKNITVTPGAAGAEPFTSISHTGDAYYLWQASGKVEFDGCEGYQVVAKAQLTDQALDGVSSPTQGAVATARGTSRRDTSGHVHGEATALASLEIYYPVLSATTVHQLVLRVWGAYTDSTTEVPIQAKCRSWTYQATPAGPVFLGSTPSADC